MSIMKNLLVVAVISLAAFGAQAQGLEKTFNASCNCYEITNHYDNGQVSSLTHQNAKGQMDGKEIVFFQDGKVQYERIWKNGKLDGAGKHYFRNGNLYYTEIYENGTKAGEWKFYDDQGDMVQTIAYSGLNSDGLYKYFHGGVFYLEQTIVQGSMSNQIVHNQEIYNQLLAEYENGRNANK